MAEENPQHSVDGHQLGIYKEYKEFLKADAHCAFIRSGMAS